MGIGVEAAITHRDLALVRYMGSDPGDELQIVHPLLPIVRTADAGEPAARVAAVEASLRGAKRRGNLMPFPRHHEITTALRAS
jgi:hypothetical protein